jgi:hypothetical protein
VQTCPILKPNLLLLVGTRDLRPLWSPPVSLNQERHTQRRKAANFNLIYFIFCDENPLKRPPWKHTRWSEHFGKFPKKNLNCHISRRGKKRVLKSPHFEEKEKQVLKSLRFVEDLGRFQAFFFWNTFIGGRSDGQTPKILYIVGTRDLRALWNPPVSLNLVHVLVFSKKIYLLYFLFLCVFYFYYYFV